MATLIEKVKEGKKVLDGKMEAAVEMVDNAIHNFTVECESLIKECSEEEFKELVESDIFEDGENENIKLMFAHMYAEAHDVSFMVVKRHQPKMEDLKDDSDK